MNNPCVHESGLAGTLEILSGNLEIFDFGATVNQASISIQGHKNIKFIQLWSWKNGDDLKYKS